MTITNISPQRPRNPVMSPIILLDLSFLFSKKVLFLAAFAGVGALIYHHTLQHQKGIETPAASDEKNDFTLTQRSTAFPQDPLDLDSAPDDEIQAKSGQPLTEENLRRLEESITGQDGQSLNVLQEPKDAALPEEYTHTTSKKPSMSTFDMADISSARSSKERSVLGAACAMFQAAEADSKKASEKKAFSYFNPWTWGQ